MKPKSDHVAHCLNTLSRGMASHLGIALEALCDGLHLNARYSCGLGFPEGRAGGSGLAVGRSLGFTMSPFLPAPCRAMSHQVLLLLAVLTLGLATSQQRDKVPCKMVRSPALAG